MSSNEESKELTERRVQKVVSGTVMKKKKNWFESFIGVFVGEDAQSVGAYILEDILIPAVKDTISDMVSKGVEMMLFGDSRSSRSSERDRRPIVSYNNYTNYSRRGDGGRERGRAPSFRNRQRQKFDDILFESRDDAEEVRESLQENIVKYGEVSVATLYELVGLTGDFQDNKFGWSDLYGTRVERTRQGYILRLPDVEDLD